MNHQPEIRHIGGDWKMLAPETVEERRTRLGRGAPSAPRAWRREPTNVLAAVRYHRDYTQDQVAAQLGVSSVYFGRYERGTIPLPPDLLPRLAALYGIDPADLDRMVANERETRT